MGGRSKEFVSPAGDYSRSAAGFQHGLNCSVR